MIVAAAFDLMQSTRGLQLIRLFLGAADVHFPMPVKVPDLVAIESCVGLHC
jgi:hypothetical protein